MRRPIPLAAPVTNTISLLKSFFFELGMKSFTKATRESHNTLSMNTNVSLNSSKAILQLGSGVGGACNVM